MRYWILSIFLLLIACSSGELAPVADGWRQPLEIQGWHKVQPGETLYSIAWRYGRDYRELVEINHLSSPNNLKVGQNLSLVPIPAARKPAEKPVQKPITAAPKAAPTKPQAKPKAPAVKSTGAVRWRWPAKGNVFQHFGTQNNNGLKIVGKAGESVYAAAAGEVVYSGSGLRGYGNMLIIKHNDEYLSAYAHNRELLVKEGARVKQGQIIARMGDSEANRVMLHFEIRKAGKPQDPIKLLPKR